MTNPEVRLRNYTSAFCPANHGTDENAPSMSVFIVTQHTLTNILPLKIYDFMITIPAYILGDSSPLHLLDLNSVMSVADFSIDEELLNSHYA